MAKETTLGLRLFEGIEGEIAELCRRYEVRELALFGSALGDSFREDSDVDLLVAFEPEARVGLIKFGELQRELSELLGRKVDLGTKSGLKPLIRDQVLASARVLYAA